MEDKIVDISILTPVNENIPVHIIGRFGDEIDISFLEKHDCHVNQIYSVVNKNGEYVDVNGNVTNIENRLTVYCRELLDIIGDEF